MSSRITQGVWASVISSLAFAIMDATSKALVQTMHPSTVLVLRTVLLLGGTLAWVFIMRRPGSFATTAVRGTIVRSMVFGLTSLLIVVSLKYVSLAETMAIYFLNPVLAVPLAAFLLREPAGRWAIPAALLGFAGVLLVMQPTTQGIKLAYLIPLGAAISGAVHDVMSRRLKGSIAPLSLMIYGMMAALFWGLITADRSRLAMPVGREWWIVLLAAVSGFVANLLVIVSFQLVPASLSSPLRYLLLAWSALIGWLVWDQLPNFLAWVGILMILGAGLLAIASSLKPAPAIVQVQP